MSERSKVRGVIRPDVEAGTGHESEKEVNITIKNDRSSRREDGAASSPPRRRRKSRSPKAKTRKVR
jgi:hypothetical protein